MEYFAFILLSIVILLLMVLIHEAGHYTAAKILGFTVDEFAIGFGPKIFSRLRKNGERFSLRVLPLGGFCAFYGETEEEEKEKEKDKKSKKKKGESNADTAVATTEITDTVEAEATESAVSDTKTNSESEDLLSYVMRTNKQEAAEAAANVLKEDVSAVEKPLLRLSKDGKPAIPFNAQKPWKRIIVLLGGVVFNFLSAIIFSLIYIGVVGFPVPEITDVYKYVDSDTLIETAYNDFEAGDKIIAINGDEITVLRSYNDIMEDIGDIKLGTKITFTVLRGDKEVDVVAECKQIVPTAEGEKAYEGFGFKQTSTYIGNTAGNAFAYCVPYTFKLSWSILGSFGDIVTGKQSITSMTGPVGSIKLMADVTIANWRNILILLPLLASNLAIFNLLPIPALDGARIVFTIIEWIRKKPINRKVEGMIHFVGMAVLLLFVLVVDILSFAL